MQKNLYIEYRKWVFFWGIFLDGQNEVQKILDEYNIQGWHCVQFEWTTSKKYNIFRWIFIFLVTILSLGIISCWNGFSIVFEKSLTASNDQTKKSVSYQSWKISNPNKTLNDYYNEVG